MIIKLFLQSSDIFQTSLFFFLSLQRGLCVMKRISAIVIFCLTALCLKAQNVSVSKIYITGQEITKEHVIRREVTVKEGDILPVATLETHFRESKENLLNTSLFHYVDITYQELPTNQSDSLSNQTDVTSIEITVKVEERWYWWPFFEFKLEDKNTSSWFKHMDTDKITYNIGLKVYNLWGLGPKFEVGALLG